MWQIRFIGFECDASAAAAAAQHPGKNLFSNSEHISHWRSPRTSFFLSHHPTNNMTFDSLNAVESIPRPRPWWAKRGGEEACKNGEISQPPNRTGWSRFSRRNGLTGPGHWKRVSTVATVWHLLVAAAAAAVAASAEERNLMGWTVRRLPGRVRWAWQPGHPGPPGVYKREWFAVGA